MSQAIENKIINRVYGKKRGWVFTPKNFLDLGSSEAIRIALHRLVKKGTIRRLTHGVYDYPKEHPKLGLLSPSIDAIANAVKDRDAVRIMPSRAYAANLLGLSEQVPMRVVFLTDGQGRKVTVGKQVIELKSTRPSKMATSDRITGLVIQALSHIGKDRVDDTVIEKLKKRLSDEDKQRLLKDISHAPAWMASILRKIA